MYCTSLSWDILEPKKDDEGNLENFSTYCLRIEPEKNFPNIPIKVFEQWLWAHHDKPESKKNYGWLDFQKIKIYRKSITTSNALNLNILESYKNYVSSKLNYSCVDDFRVKEEDKKFWKKYGTWRTPPIILDVNSLKDTKPIWSEIIPPYQLVEGHTRLGYLLSLIEIQKKEAKNCSNVKHLVYLISY